MYVIARLSRKSIDFVNYVNSSGLNRKESFNIALAYALTRELSLPSAEVTDIEQYFRIHHESTVFNRLGVVNEVLSLKDEIIRSHCRAFYSFRYNACYPAAIPLAMRDTRGVADFFGASKFFSENTLDVIDKEGPEITRLVNGFTEMLIDAIKENQERADSAPGLEDRHVAA